MKEYVILVYTPKHMYMFRGHQTTYYAFTEEGVLFVFNKERNAIEAVFKTWDYYLIKEAEKNYNEEEPT